MFQLLFPQYKTRRWVYLPLGTLALAEQRPGQPNPLLDPFYCQRWVRRLHRRYHASCSYGGWFEDRSTLWQGHYMKPNLAFHLGVDFNVPERSRVYSPADALVAETWHDEDSVGGWGGRIALELRPRLILLLAHLGKIRVRPGSRVRAGQLPRERRRPDQQRKLVSASARADGPRQLRQGGWLRRLLGWQPAQVSRSVQVLAAAI